MNSKDPVATEEVADVLDPAQTPEPDLVAQSRRRWRITAITSLVALGVTLALIVLFVVVKPPQLTLAELTLHPAGNPGAYLAPEYVNGATPVALKGDLIAISDDHSVAIVETKDGDVVGYSLATGKQSWTLRGQSCWQAATGGTIFCLDPTAKDGDQALSRLNPATGVVKPYSTARPDSWDYVLGEVDGSLVFQNGMGGGYAIGADGEQKYSFDSGATEYTSSDCQLAGSRLLCLYEGTADEDETDSDVANNLLKLIDAATGETLFQATNLTSPANLTSDGFLASTGGASVAVFDTTGKQLGETSQTFGMLPANSPNTSSSDQDVLYANEDYLALPSGPEEAGFFLSDAAGKIVLAELPYSSDAAEGIGRLPQAANSQVLLQGVNISPIGTSESGEVVVYLNEMGIIEMVNGHTGASLPGADMTEALANAGYFAQVRNSLVVVFSSSASGVYIPRPENPVILVPKV